MGERVAQSEGGGPRSHDRLRRVTLRLALLCLAFGVGGAFDLVNKPVAAGPPTATPTWDSTGPTYSDSVTAPPGDTGGERTIDPLTAGHPLRDKKLQTFIDKCSHGDDVWREVQLSWPATL